MTSDVISTTLTKLSHASTTRGTIETFIYPITLRNDVIQPRLTSREKDNRDFCVPICPFSLVNGYLCDDKLITVKLHSLPPALSVDLRKRTLLSLFTNWKDFFPSFRFFPLKWNSTVKRSRRIFINSDRSE